MKDQKYTDEQIIKALECCSNNTMISLCPKCAYNGKTHCKYFLRRDALALINQQRIKIEQLKQKHELAVAEREANVKGFTETLKTIKTETIKEFAERLKNKSQKRVSDIYGARVFVKDIDNLVKEMTGASNEN